MSLSIRQCVSGLLPQRAGGSVQRGPSLACMNATASTQAGASGARGGLKEKISPEAIVVGHDGATEKKGHFFNGGVGRGNEKNSLSVSLPRCGGNPAAYRARSPLEDGGEDYADWPQVREAVGREQTLRDPGAGPGCKLQG